MLQRKKFLIGGIIVFLAIGYLGFIGFQNSATYYYTVSEFAQKGTSVHGENVRVKGNIVPDSVESKEAGRILKFTVAEGEDSMPVTYQGVVPDTFKPDIEIVVEGKLGTDGVFVAHTLMPKCPSKYEAAP
jgi:cytochrome c-type biogenesis protein CcmE